MAERPTTGPVAALMDEFERAASELARIVGGLADDEFHAVRGATTTEPDCSSIAAIMRHVVDAGYAEADEFRAVFGIESQQPEPGPNTPAQCPQALADMVEYMAATLEGHWEMTGEQNNACLITVPWGTVYTFEQLFEHAIVHIHRHRRQIERFLAKQ